MSARYTQEEGKVIVGFLIERYTEFLRGHAKATRALKAERIPHPQLVGQVAYWRNGCSTLKRCLALIAQMTPEKSLESLLPVEELENTDA